MQKRYKRTGINTEAKYLLLKYALEDLQCIAVEFRTHILNQTSRRAIERLGAKLDGILRNHRLTTNGQRRDTCIYSITDYDWQAVKTHLEWLMKNTYNLLINIKIFLDINTIITIYLL